MIYSLAVKYLNCSLLFKNTDGEAKDKEIDRAEYNTAFSSHPFGMRCRS